MSDFDHLAHLSLMEVASKTWMAGHYNEAPKAKGSFDIEADNLREYVIKYRAKCKELGLIKD